MIDLSTTRPVKMSDAIHVDIWDCDVYVREMTGRQLEVLKRHIVTVNGVSHTENELGLVLVLSLVDKDGNFLFSEKDLDALLDQPLSVTAPLFAKAVEVSGLGALGIEEATKNLKNHTRSSRTS
jgi:hypothetical protein